MPIKSLLSEAKFNPDETVIIQSNSGEAAALSAAGVWPCEPQCSWALWSPNAQPALKGTSRRQSKRANARDWSHLAYGSRPLVGL